MTRTISTSARLTLRLAILATLLIGPLAALGVAKAEHPAVGKQGAGFVLFVSLQRASMS
ncbi:hypothetical protein [Rhizobium halophytocola]|uniref:Uncharacterized protein n=1 Tax=Rhizobium halophytocola TaxID=735519 RepID=A0ABS4E3C7_9HYPH|nr:hypothetical protein [Rhizobium halophytocola]MBP1852428.1 hypothetical protein [Rhizobium halophytocola]